MPALFADLRYVLRQLRNAPVYALTAALTLGLGLGANAAIFSLFDQALVRALPVRDPAQMVVLRGTGKAWEGHTSDHGGGEDAYFSYPMYRDLRDRNQAFTGLVATAPADVVVSCPGLSEHERAEMVSGNYFAVLGVQPALGRVFSQAEDTVADANPVAVLSFAFWHDRLGGDPGIVGRTLSVNAHPFQVIGVAAPGFRSAVWGEAPGVFVPITMLGEIVPGKSGPLQNHTDRWLNILGRMRPGETRATAEAALAPLWHALRADELKVLGTRSPEFIREFLTDSHLLAEPGARGFSYDRDTYEQPLRAVMAMALLILAMAGINVGSLLLVRSAGRAREFSLRTALGARTGRLARQLMIEGLLLGLAGAAAGLVLAPLLTRSLVNFLKGDQAYGDFTAALDPRLIGFTSAAALLVSVLFSLAPMLQLRRVQPASALREVAGSGGAGALRLRRAVVFLQITLSVLLLTGAGLFVRTIQKLRTVDVGYPTAHLVTFGIAPQLAGYAPAAIPALYDRLLSTVQALPGVAEAAVTDDPELADNGQSENVTVSGDSRPEDDTNVERTSITPGFFSTLRVPLIAGRIFNADDAPAHPLVAVVNRSFAEHFCGGAAQCLGRRVGHGSGKDVKLETEIVGVVADVRHESVRRAAEPTMFTPLQQAEKPGRAFFYIRTYADPAGTLASLPPAVARVDSALALAALRTMDTQLDDSLSNERTIALLAAGFGALAAALAGVGIYGVLAYATAQRTREIGVRIALGSSRVAIAGLVLGDVSRLAGWSIAAALPLAFGASRLLGSLLFGIAPADPASFLIAVLLVVVIAAFAAFLPARRAASVDPVIALRSE